MSKTIAIIPARGGSKRIPRKNLEEFMGETLLVHSIRYAKENSEHLDDVVVSTDDPEIRKISEDLGVKVIDRPKDLATDTASTISVLQHAVESLDSEVETIVLLQVTNPLRPETLLRDALGVFEEKGVDSLFTVSPNLQKFGRIRDEKFVPFNYEFGQRSQDMEPLYFENGLLYIAKANVIRQGELFSENHFPYVVEHPFAYVDIDEPADLEYAEFIWKRHK